jgi:hypothetical protein
VEAEDPQGSALGFVWSASGGTLSTPVHGATTSQVSWAAPCASTGELPSVTVTVSNALGLSTPFTFTFAANELPECVPPPGTWSAIGGLVWGADAITATLLPSGRVLVVGRDGSWPGLVQVYDPVTGLSFPTGSLTAAHSWHTATLLPSG